MIAAERGKWSGWRSSMYTSVPWGKKNQLQCTHESATSWGRTRPGRPSARCRRCVGSSPSPITRSAAIG